MSSFVDHFEIEIGTGKPKIFQFKYKKRREITINLMSRDILNDFNKIPDVLIIKLKKDVTSYDKIALLY